MQAVINPILPMYASRLNFKKDQFPIEVLLIDDQIIIAEAIRQLLDDERDINFHYCSDPSKAIQMATEIMPTVILQDLVMPQIDGLVLVKYFRANPATRDIPLVVLSSKEDPKIKAEAFSFGANDYMVKIPKKEELVARIRYHSKSYIRLIERNIAYEKLEESQKALTAELTEAAEYVKSLLPLPLEGEIQTAWRFIPSTQLGGDAFGYHWLDQDHLSIYLLDVCGHGVGAALLSISVINVLRSQTLPKTNFFDPENVLNALNEAFPMEKHNGMFFTIWYGVYNKRKQEIVYASGGHPPAVLITDFTTPAQKITLLSTAGLVVGGIQEATFTKAQCTMPFHSKLFLFSDGVFEIAKNDGSMMHYKEFINYFENTHSSPSEDIEMLVNRIIKLNGSRFFADDFSILEVMN